MCNLSNSKSQQESVEQLSSKITSGILPNKSDEATPVQESDSFLFKPAVYPKTEEALRLVNELMDFAAYDNTNGGFVIHTYRPGGLTIGSQLGTLRHGRMTTTIKNVTRSIHDLVWLWFNGVLPEYYIDHINGDGSDNRISNLRDVPQKINTRNSRMKSNNSSGITGVVWDKSRNKWKAQIMVNYKCIFIGRSSSIEEAIELRENYIKSHPHLGFTERHGK